MEPEAGYITITCETCRGTGWTEPDANRREACRKCKGHGRVQVPDTRKGRAYARDLERDVRRDS